MRLVDLTGQRFGRLTVLSRAPNDGRRTRWNCRCDCGTEKSVGTEALRCGDTSSCGCLQIEARVGLATHGQSHTVIHRLWCHMRQRCRNPENPSYAHYGGRGIAVCERWDVFENFYADMGDPPPGMTLDRIDNDGPYSPENCRWADKRTQASNRRFCFRVRYGGEIMTASEFARRVGSKTQTMHMRARKLGRARSEILEAAELLTVRSKSASY